MGLKVTKTSAPAQDCCSEKLRHMIKTKKQKQKTALKNRGRPAAPGLCLQPRASDVDRCSKTAGCLAKPISYKKSEMQKSKETNKKTEADIY